MRYDWTEIGSRADGTTVVRSGVRTVCRSGASVTLTRELLLPSGMTAVPAAFLEDFPEAASFAELAAEILDDAGTVTPQEGGGVESV